MGTGSGLLERARKHIGEDYVNRQVPKDNPDWKGPWDCAEFASWLVYQEAGILYGCTDNKADPGAADAYTGAWKRDSQTLGRRISVEDAAGIAGAFLLRYPPTAGTMGHIAISDGRGGTVEAKGRNFGVVADKVSGRRWDTGVLVPGIDYAQAGAPLDIAGPKTLFALGLPNMDTGRVSQIQQALAQRGFDPGAITGLFDRATAKAVGEFQTQTGLVSDGEVGKDTAAALGISLIEPILKGIAATGIAGPYAPLIGIAASILPGIVRAIAGDATGKVEEKVGNAVVNSTGTSDPAAARKAVEADPAAAQRLQTELAGILLEQEKARQRAEAEMLKTRLDAELASLRTNVENTEDARRRALDYARLGGPMSWGAPLVSAIVTLGFFAILIVLIRGSRVTGDPNVLQIINITVGALAAAFATVVNFWLGSSQGSRQKDAANASIQFEQAQQTKDIIRNQAQAVEQAQQAVVLAERSAPVAAVKTSNFQACVDLVLGQEGGFSNHPRDPGGATQYGITLATLRDVRGDDTLTAADVQALDKQTACEIYRTRYWNVLRCDDLPRGVDLVVFDFGVNAGPSRSARLLQKTIGAEADGSVGPATIGAAKQIDPKMVITSFSAGRLEYHRSLPTWETFRNGWTSRINTIQKAALDMADLR